ncbi:hypothetical protein [Spartinivicinus poritis]|uniref:Uncharacterized protein n=1 Tax=Spartinivicinus poritis TaxID=2994640 RepID=A0ABT5UCA9_9GAMM|nr:hypothetical protein [Spartinivicinus sp. A2-2]MDE1463621.1 hypothetical protein [Spartinivicinus sp. A2-2]
MQKIILDKVNDIKKIRWQSAGFLLKLCMAMILLIIIATGLVAGVSILSAILLFACAWLVKLKTESLMEKIKWNFHGYLKAKKTA